MTAMEEIEARIAAKRAKAYRPEGVPKDVIEAQIAAKTNERDQISGVGPMLLFFAGIVVLFLPIGMLSIIGAILLIGGSIKWGVSQIDREDTLSNEITILMEDLVRVQ